MPEGQTSYYEQYAIAAQAMAGSDFAHARQLLQQADKLQPDYPLPLAMLVKVALTSGDIAGLKESLWAAARRFPADVRLHAELAQDLVHEKQLDLALAESLRAAAIDGVDGRASLNLAVLENQAGAFGDAAKDAAAIENQSQFTLKLRASAAAVAGLSLASLGKDKEAIDFFYTAIRLDPQQEQPYLSLARIYEAAHDNQAREQILIAARTVIGDSSNVLLALGTALISSRNYVDASQVLTALIDRTPNEFEAYLKLAEAYRNLGEPNRATATLQELSRRKPDDPLLHIVIARSLLDEAAIDYNRVLQELAASEQILPGSYDVNYLRGKVLLATGKDSEAAASLRRAADLSPTEPGAHYQLAILYRKLRKSELAHQEFDRVKNLKGSEISLGETQ